MRRLDPSKKKNIRNILFAVIGVGIAALLLSDRLSSHHPSTGGGVATRPGGTVVVVQSTTSSDTPTAASSPAAGTSSPAAAPATGDGDDGVGSEPPTSAQPTSDPAVRDAVEGFTAAWLNTYKRTDKQWRDALLPLVTEDIAADLADADPASVPHAGRVGGVKLSVDGQLVVADVQVITTAAPDATLGALHLSVVHRGNDWLISEIDWAAQQ